MTTNLICELDTAAAELDTAAGDLAIITPAPRPSRPPASNLRWHCSQAALGTRQALFGQRPATLWLTGLSGAGKSTLAYSLECALLAAKHPCFVLDGDNVRHHLNSDLGFSADDRKENIRRTAEVAHLMNEAGLIVIASLISPLREDRAMAQAIIGAERFVEVHVSASVEVCEQRDPKGLYAKARAGQIPNFTGISAPYETPLAPALSLDTGKLPLEESTHRLVQHLSSHFFGAQR